MSAHRIRLQGPWEAVAPGGVANGPPIEIRVPAAWRALFGETAGTATFRRNFNSPTNLTDDDQVFIRIPEKAGRILACSLNGVSLQSQPADEFAFNATRHLREFNRLEIQLFFAPEQHRDTPGGLWEPVLVEIHAANSPTG